MRHAVAVQAETSASGSLRMSNHCSDDQLDVDLTVNLGPASATLSVAQYGSMVGFAERLARSALEADVVYQASALAFLILNT